jgi:nitronate monooxygenase
MLRRPKLKHWMRSYYALTSLRRLKKSSLSSAGAREYWQAGKSVGGIHEIKPVAEIVREFAAALED